MEGSSEPFLFPQLGPYPVYDDAAYSWMTEDEPRTRRYRAAISSHAPGKTVLDIGTGRDVNWAIASVEAGASRVYAIERRASVYDAARETLRRAGLAGRIELLPGDSTSVELPERVDLIVSEIIGDVGSCEGAWSVLQDARRRFLRPGGFMVPRRCLTYVAAAMLPESLYQRPRLGPMGRRYRDRIFASVGRQFDLRLSMANVGAGCCLSEPDVFEDLDFERADLPLNLQRDVRLRVTRPGRLDGFLLWINLYCGLEDPIDSLNEKTSWLPAWFPVFYPGIAVQAGDEIRATCGTVLSDDGIHPDYAIRGEVRGSERAHRFDYRSEHHGSAYRGNAFYRALFDED